MYLLIFYMKRTKLKKSKLYILRVSVTDKYINKTINIFLCGSGREIKK